MKDSPAQPTGCGAVAWRPARGHSRLGRGQVAGGRWRSVRKWHCNADASMHQPVCMHVCNPGPAHHHITQQCDSPSEPHRRHTVSPRASSTATCKATPRAACTQDCMHMQCVQQLQQLCLAGQQRSRRLPCPSPTRLHQVRRDGTRLCMQHARAHRQVRTYIARLRGQQQPRAVPCVASASSVPGLVGTGCDKRPATCRPSCLTQADQIARRCHS